MSALPSWTPWRSRKRSHAVMSRAVELIAPAGAMPSMLIPISSVTGRTV